MHRSAMNLILSLVLLIGSYESSSAQNPYLHDGSIGNQKTPSQDKAVYSPLSYRPFEQLVGEQFMFLPKAKHSQRHGYSECTTEKDKFKHPSYEEAVGRIGTIMKVEKADFSDQVVEIMMLDNKQIYKCTSFIEQIECLGSIQDLDAARRKWKGAAIWIKEGKIRTYDADEDSFEELKVKKLSGGLITNVVAAWSSYAPVRIIFKLEKGEEGFIDINPSGTNVPEGSRDKYKFEDYFFSDNPKTIYKNWPKDIWESIEQDRVRIGMNKEQVILSWGKPQSSNKTVIQNIVSEQWIYKGGGYLYFTNGVLSSMQQ